MPQTNVVGFPEGNNFWGESLVSIPRASTFVNVLLKLQSKLNLLCLDLCVRKYGTQESGCLLGTSYPAVEGSVVRFEPSSSEIEISSKQTANKLDTCSIAHVDTAVKLVSRVPVRFESGDVLGNSNVSFSIEQPSNISQVLSVHTSSICQKVHKVKALLARLANWANSVNTPKLGKTERSSSLDENVQRLYTRPERDEIVRTAGKPAEVSRNDSPLSYERLTDCNSKYLGLNVDPDINMDMTEWKVIPNQLDRVAQIVWKGNLISSRRASLGVLTGISA